MCVCVFVCVCVGGGGGGGEGQLLHAPAEKRDVGMCSIPFSLFAQIPIFWETIAL
jgi:hypothetical protein